MKVRRRSVHSLRSMTSGCSSDCSDCTFASYSERSRASSRSMSCSHSHRCGRPKRTQSYKRIKKGLRKSIPAAIVLYAFHKLSDKAKRKGLSARQVITFLKKRYRVVDDPRRTGRSIGAMLRAAVDFGLLEKRGTRYYLKQNHH